jgi:hypothetical protein
MKLLVFLIFLLSGCAQPKYADESPAVQAERSPSCFKSGDCVSFKWEKAPTESDFGLFSFQITGASTSISDVPSVLLWMPSMGHGSSPVRVTPLGSGTYRAERVFFTMRGNWEIHFQLKDGEEIKDEVVFPYTF